MNHHPELAKVTRERDHLRNQLWNVKVWAFYACFILVPVVGVLLDV